MRTSVPLPIVPPPTGQYSAAQYHHSKVSHMPADAPALSSHDCLVAIMISVSMSDATMRTSELVTIQQVVNHLPIFAEYDVDRINKVAQTVLDLFEEEDGLDALFGLIRDALPAELRETAYALACDVAASDGHIGQQELRLLEEIRYELDIDRLHAAAIERGARARYITL